MNIIFDFKIEHGKKNFIIKAFLRFFMSFGFSYILVFNSELFSSKYRGLTLGFPQFLSKIILSVFPLIQPLIKKMNLHSSAILVPFVFLAFVFCFYITAPKHRKLKN